MATMALGSGTTTTMRVDRPDGTSDSIVWHDVDRTTIEHLAADGTCLRRHRVDHEADGRVVVRRSVDGEPERILDPSETSVLRNPYGSTTETHDYGGLIEVSYGFDNDGSFRTAAVTAPWGRQDVEIRPDGSRIVRWSCPLHDGEARWDAAGRLVRYQVSYADGSSTEWDLIDDRGRSVSVSVDGETSLDADAAPPIGARPDGA